MKHIHESIDYDGYEFDDYQDNIAMRRRIEHHDYQEKYGKPSDIEGINNIYTLLKNADNIYTIATPGQARLLYKKGWEIIGGYNTYDEAYNYYEDYLEHSINRDFINPIDALYEAKKNDLYENIINKISKQLIKALNAYN